MKKEKIFWGMFFIIAAVFIVVSRLGFFPDMNLFRLFLTVFLAALLIKSIVGIEFYGIFFSIAFIGCIYAEQLNIEDLTPWTLLGVALLLSIGFSMIFHRHGYIGKSNCERIKEGEYSKTYNEEDGNGFQFSNSFSESIKYVNSDHFEYANLSCSFGDMKVYFDNAILANGNATVNVDVSFGAIELFVPKSWNVTNNIHVSLAGVDEKNKRNNVPSGNQTLTLTGNVNFAGVTIIYI